jgi:hypothetical protein
MRRDKLLDTARTQGTRCFVYLLWFSVFFRPLDGEDVTIVCTSCNSTIGLFGSSIVWLSI